MIPLFACAALIVLCRFEVIVAVSPAAAAARGGDSFHACWEASNHTWGVKMHRLLPIFGIPMRAVHSSLTLRDLLRMLRSGGRAWGGTTPCGRV